MIGRWDCHLPTYANLPTELASVCQDARPIWVMGRRWPLVGVGSSATEEAPGSLQGDVVERWLAGPTESIRKPGRATTPALTRHKPECRSALAHVFEMTLARHRLDEEVAQCPNQPVDSVG